MKGLIDKLPGVELPVGEVTKRLDTMWQGFPSELRATRMSMVLHFGWEVSEVEARERFDALIRLARSYPARIIVLCPSRALSDGSMQAKLFSQCYIGDLQGEAYCCEALLLAYQPEDYGFLGNQVSVWLEADLPVYHWFVRVPSKRIEKYFDNLLSGVRRCIYDSSIEGADLDGLPWPEQISVSDLARARLLPARQAIGQYLSGYDSDGLCRGLKSARVRHCGPMSGEGRRLMEWVRDCLADGGGSAPDAEYEIEERNAGDCLLTLDLEYEDDRYFRWQKLSDGLTGLVKVSLGKPAETLTLRVRALEKEEEISEALFF